MNPQEKIELMNLIRFIRQKFSIAILLIEHDMKLVMNVCEKHHGHWITAKPSPPERRRNPIQSEGDRSVSWRFRLEEMKTI